MKLGLFGGSFDPPHMGHLLPVQAARERLALDRVLYLPTGRPPHKPGRRFAPPHARYTMVELMLLAEEGLYASPFELDAERRSYTIDTLESFRRRFPRAELHYLVGGDSFAALHTWHRWREIAALARLVVLARPGWEAGSLAEAGPAAVRDLLAGGRAEIVSAPLVDGSSTGVREALARGEPPPDGLLPPLVLDYVQKYHLYR